MTWLCSKYTCPLHNVYMHQRSNRIFPHNTIIKLHGLLVNTRGLFVKVGISP
uniref:Uncharacterized protein n=1 Tax=Arundo donax TaxID=35708 RepID=A0A0A9CCA6_ARUDO